MRVSDLPPRWQMPFINFFEEYFHDEEEDADPETFDQCDNVDECFDKLGAERMQEIWDMFANQTEDFRLMVHSRDDYD